MDRRANAQIVQKRDELKKTWRLLLRNGYTDFKCAVILGGETGQWFDIKRGVHQGAPFSMYLYMIFVNDLIKELRSSGHGIIMSNTSVASRAHADDVTLLSIYKIALNKLLEIALKYSKIWRYSYDKSKTVAMIEGKDQDPTVQISIDETLFELVKSQKHIGGHHDYAPSGSNMISQYSGELIPLEEHCWRHGAWAVRRSQCQQHC